MMATNTEPAASAEATDHVVRGQGGSGHGEQHDDEQMSLTRRAFN